MPTRYVRTNGQDGTGGHDGTTPALAWLTIGYVEDLNRVTVDDLKNFFLRWYGPNNATLTIGGFLMMPFSSAFLVNNIGITQDHLPLVFMFTGMATIVDKYVGPQLKQFLGFDLSQMRAAVE